MLGDDDGFIDAGEMRRNYVFAPATAAAAVTAQANGGTGGRPDATSRAEEADSDALSEWAQVPSPSNEQHPDNFSTAGKP